MKTVIITGANGNLGMAVTKEFLDKGYKVIVTVVTEAMKDDFDANPNLEVVAVDLSNESDSVAFVNNVISKYGSIYAGLLLVGGFAMGNIEETSSADIDKQISLNFKTAFHITKPLFAHMMQQGMGRIVFIGARPALEAKHGKGCLAYALSKSLLFKMAEILNETARGKNITATVVVPSTLDTEINRKSMPDANPDNWVKPATLAELLEFSVSDKSQVMREVIIKAYNNA